MAMRLLVTRPSPDGERTAAALRARGHDVQTAPLMRVEPVAADLAGDWDAIAITSANALAGVPVAALRSLPLFAVGVRSAQAAREAGFADVISADGDARDLVRLIASRRPANLLYLAGEDRAADLVGELKARGIAAGLRVVYRAVTAPFSSALIHAFRRGAFDGVLHFSRRSAENFVAGARAAGVTVGAFAARHYCLSAQVAEPLAAAGAAHIAVAARPEESALIELLDAPPG
jgi:uroporphyrinogen-III synthase